MAHQDIRRLTNELDAAKNNNCDPSGMLQRLMYSSMNCGSILDFVSTEKANHEAPSFYIWLQYVCIQ